jgi:hypothetical protein
VVIAIILILGLILGSLEGNNVARKAKDGWDGMDDFGEGDLMILGDDGDDAHYIPMTEPVRIKDQWSNEKASVVVVFCGGHEIADAGDWFCQTREMGKREFRQYKKLAKNREGKVMLFLHRTGESGDTATRYSVRLVSELDKPEIAACQALLADYEKENK